MYVIPLVLIILVGIIAVAWTPIFAVLAFIVLFALFLAYVGISRRADQTRGLNRAKGAERGPHEPSDSAVGR
jgi:hypothetical protein